MSTSLTAMPLPGPVECWIDCWPVAEELRRWLEYHDRPRRPTPEEVAAGRLDTRPMFDVSFGYGPCAESAARFSLRVHPRAGDYPRVVDFLRTIVESDLEVETALRTSVLTRGSTP